MQSKSNHHHFKNKLKEKLCMMTYRQINYVELLNVNTHVSCSQIDYVCGQS